MRKLESEKRACLLVGACCEVVGIINEIMCLAGVGTEEAKSSENTGSSPPALVPSL